MRKMIVAAVMALSCWGTTAGAAEMEFTLSGNGGNCGDCEWVSAQGDIMPDSYKKLLAYAKDNGVPQIYLNSQGGSVAGAILLGATIRKLGGATNVGRTSPEPDTPWQKLDAGVCLGACALAFLGGTNRTLDKDSTLGTLPFGDTSPPARLDNEADGLTLPPGGTLISQTLGYVIQMGVDPRALIPDDKTKLSFTPDELNELRLAWDPNLMAQWQIEPFKRGVVAFNKSQDGRSTLTLYCEAGDKTLLYSVEKAPGASNEDGSGDESDPYDFAGATIPVNKITSKPTATLSRTYYALPDNFVPDAKGESGSLTNTATAGHASWFTVNFKNKGLADAARIAFRNCI